MNGKTYQIRHREAGVFQGEVLGCAFWSDMSNVPEIGISEFEEINDATAFINMLCHVRPDAFKPEDLVVEEFDYNLDYKLTTGFDAEFTSRAEYLTALGQHALNVIHAVQ